MPSRIQSRVFGPASVLALLLACGLLGGCGIFSPDEKVDEPVPIEPYPLATTETQLIQNFIDAHQDRNFQEYDLLLHENFEFLFAAEDIDASEVPDGVWDRQRDTASAEAMFSGKPGKLDPLTGERQSPVQSIVLALGIEEAWKDYTGTEFESDRTATYRVDMSVTYDNQDVALVTGLQEFYAKKVTLDDGTEVFQLRAWRDTGQATAKVGPSL